MVERINLGSFKCKDEPINAQITKGDDNLKLGTIIMNKMKTQLNICQNSWCHLLKNIMMIHH